MKLDILKPVITKVEPVVHHICKVGGAKAPAILLVSGLVGVGIGTGVACVRSAKRVPDILEKHEEALADLQPEEDEDSEEIDKKAVTKVYLNMAVEIAKVYALPAAIISAGVGCIIGAHGIQHHRIAMLSGAYNTLMATFGEYRDRVKAKEGEEADLRYLYGEEDAKIEVTGKNGKVREKAIKVLGTGDSQDLYHCLYSISTTNCWTADPFYNLEFLLNREREANRILHSQGYLFLDDVYRMLGLDLVNRTNAKLVGWVLDGEGDNCVTFGIRKFDRKGEACNYQLVNDASYAAAIESATTGRIPDYVENPLAVEDNMFWLEFNCDGVIIDKIG